VDGATFLEVQMFEDNLSEAVLAAAALGTAAFGIVEALKAFPWLGQAGFSTLVQFLEPFEDALKVAYGPDAIRILRGQYRGDTDDLKRVIRQGIRIGLTPVNAEKLAAALKIADARSLQQAASEVWSGALSDESRNVIGRFELAADARIDAGLTLALDHYARSAKISAMVVALTIAIVMAHLLGVGLLYGLIVGLAAVPLAPVAKDLVTAIKSAAEALRARV
jgi:hypothetical protein